MKKFLLLVGLILSFSTQAWEPTKPIRVLIPTGPGSGNDLSSRNLFSIVESKGKAKFYTEYKPGADGVVMLNQLNDSAPDGYTVGIPGCFNTFVSTDIFHRDLIKIDPLDMTLITNIGKSPLAIVANSKSKVNTVPQLIDYVRSGENINVGSNDTNFAGGAMTMIQFLKEVGGRSDKVSIIPYKGPAQALADAAAGVVEFAVLPVAVANTLVPTGKVKIIAIAGEKKIEAIKDIPLLNKWAPGLNQYGCWDILMPKNVPEDVIQWYKDNVIPELYSDAYKQFMKNNLIFLDDKSVGPKNVKQDMLNLRNKWEPTILKLKYDMEKTK